MRAAAKPGPFSGIAAAIDYDSDSMSDFLTVARTADIPPGSMQCIEIGDRRIVLINLGGDFHALDDCCTHAQASLSEGEISGTEIVCPLHFATFDICTGRCTGPPADEDVRRYETRVVGDEVQLKI